MPCRPNATKSGIWGNCEQHVRPFVDVQSKPCVSLQEFISVCPQDTDLIDFDKCIVVEVIQDTLNTHLCLQCMENLLQESSIPLGGGCCRHQLFPDIQQWFCNALHLATTPFELRVRVAWLIGICEKLNLNEVY